MRKPYPKTDTQETETPEKETQYRKPPCGHPLMAPAKQSFTVCLWKVLKTLVFCTVVEYARGVTHRQRARLWANK